MVLYAINSTVGGEQKSSPDKMEKIEMMFKEIKTSMDSMNEKLEGVLSEVKQLKEENETLKQHVDRQEERMERLERELRVKNIIVKGVEDSENEDEQEVKQKVERLMSEIGTEVDKDVDIDIVRRIGKFEKDRRRPILVKFTREGTKLAILKNAKNLKGTNVWIDEDYSKRTQNERKALIPKLREAREKGHRAHIRYNKLVINGAVWREKEGEKDTERAAGGSTGQKRTALERSPDGETSGEHARKKDKIQKGKN